eukprot:Gb_00813 [translate_table: standard]
MVTLVDASSSSSEKIVEAKQEEPAMGSDEELIHLGSVSHGEICVGYNMLLQGCDNYTPPATLLNYHSRSRIVPSKAAGSQRFVMPTVKLTFQHMEYSQQTLFYSTQGHSFSLIAEKMRQSLSEVLVEFYPFEGKVAACDQTNWNDAGVDFIEATAAFSREEAVDSKNSSILSQLIPSYDTVEIDSGTASGLPVLLVQVTELRGGTMALGWATNETMMDMASVWQFLSSWAHLCKGDVSLQSIAEDCPILRSPPNRSYSRRYNRRQELMPAGSRIRTFHFSSHSVQGLKRAANVGRRGSHGRPFSTFHSVGAHLWRSITKARNLHPTASTGCAFRGILSSLDALHGVATAGNLAKRSLAFAAALMQHNEVNAESFFSTVKANNIGNINGNMVYVGKCEGRESDSGSGINAVATSTSYSSCWEDGQVMLFGGEGDGGSVDAEIILRSDAMENMETDSAFMLTCS